MEVLIHVFYVLLWDILYLKDVKDVSIVFFENGYENCDGYMCISDKTYDDIENSKSAWELLNAVRKRADYLDSLIKTCENDN